MLVWSISTTQLEPFSVSLRFMGLQRTTTLTVSVLFAINITNQKILTGS
jgi:hypothetical protein